MGASDQLDALLGKEADVLSPSVIARLKAEWAEDLARWERRDMSARRYVYLWADGVYLQAHQDADARAQCVLLKGAGRLHRRLSRERPVLA